MTDIIDRLRRSGNYECYCAEAADKIELLRVVLRQLVARCSQWRRRNG
jgi:hypothetical protein